MAPETQGEERPRSAEDAYDAIAPFYDDFTAHHDYELWIGNLMPELERRELHGNRLLDVACGTGKSFLPMLRRGWRVTACDISAAMVELARRKVGAEVELTVADMRELPRFGEFDLVTCLDDALNYLLDGAELEAALRGMRRNLAADGLLLFDLNTIVVYRTFFSEELEVERDGRRLLWHGQPNPDPSPGTIGEARFEALSAAGGEPLGPAETHRQRHFPEAEVRERLGRAGLECLDVFGHGDDAVLRQPLREEVHSKAVYIARPA